MSENSYIGTLLFYDKKVNFKFEDFKLELYIDVDITGRLLFENNGSVYKFVNKPIEIDVLKGVTFDDKYEIFFCLDLGKDKLNYKCSSNTLFLGKSTIIIFVTKYYLIEGNGSKGKNQMTFYSKNFHRFLDLIPTYTCIDEPNGIKTYFTKLNFPSLSMTKHFALDSINYEILPTYLCHWNGPKLDFIPGLNIIYDKPLSIEVTNKIYDTVIKMIQYLFMRSDIYPDYVEFTNESFKGKIFDFHNKPSVEEEPFTSIYRDSISWNIIYKNIDKLFVSIYNDDLHLLNIPDSKVERTYTTFMSISKDAAAFENEFDKAHKNDIQSSEERKEIEKEVIRELEQLKDSSFGKKKKIYKGFIKYVHNVSLCDKMQFAFDEYANCIHSVKERLKINMSNQEIAELCSGIRNDVDHGNKVTELKSGLAESYIILRLVIYAMQLRRLGYEDDDINLATNMLYM